MRGLSADGGCSEGGGGGGLGGSQPGGSVAAGGGARSAAHEAPGKGDAGALEAGGPRNCRRQEAGLSRIWEYLIICKAKRT